MGRAANMDVVIALPRVSKYHAYVTYADGELLICDARSTFGTFVDGLKLEPMIATPVQSGAQVELGPYSFRIYSPEGLRGFMEAIVRTRGSTPPNE